MSNDYDQYLYEAATDESDYDQYLYESVDDPESTEVNSSYGGDLIDRLQQGVLNVSADVAGAAGRLLGTDRATENYLRDWAQEQEDTISPESKESYEKFGLGDDDEMSWSGFGQHLASGAGFFGPSMLLGGVGGAALRGAGALAKGAKLSDTANKAATAAGYGGAGSLMIGGSTANEVEEGLKQMNHEQLAQLPMFNELHSTIYESMGGTPDVAKASYDQAKKLYIEQMSNEAGLKGGALGATSMGIGGPLMEKLLRFGSSSILSGAAKGFANEGLQEAVEEGGQARISNPYLGKENWEGVGERAAEGMLLGGVLGGTVGGVRGAFGEQSKRNPDDKPIVDDQGNQIGWRDQKTGESYSPIDKNLFGDLPQSPINQPEMDLARKVINPQQNFDDITRIMNMGMDEVDNEINNLLAAPLKLSSPDKMRHAPIQGVGRIDPTGKFGGPGFDEQTRPSIEGELLPEQQSTNNLLALDVDAIEGELAEYDRQSTLLNLGVKNGLISQEEATQVQNNIDNAIKAIGQQPNYQAYLNRQANNKNLANKAAPKGPFEQDGEVVGKNSKGETIYQDDNGKRYIRKVDAAKGNNRFYELEKFRGNRFKTEDEPAKTNEPKQDDLIRELEGFINNEQSVKTNDDYRDENGIFNPALALEERQQLFSSMSEPAQNLMKDFAVKNLEARIAKRESQGKNAEPYKKRLEEYKKGNINANDIVKEVNWNVFFQSLEGLNQAQKDLNDTTDLITGKKDAKIKSTTQGIENQDTAIQNEQLPLEETQDAIDTGTTTTTKARTDSIQTEENITQEFQEETRETAKSTSEVITKRKLRKKIEKENAVIIKKYEDEGFTLKHTKGKEWSLDKTGYENPEILFTQNIKNIDKAIKLYNDKKKRHDINYYSPEIERATQESIKKNKAAKEKEAEDKKLPERDGSLETAIKRIKKGFETLNFIQRELETKADRKQVYDAIKEKSGTHDAYYFNTKLDSQYESDRADGFNRAEQILNLTQPRTKNTILQEAKEKHQLKKQLDELKKFTIPPETVSIDGEDQTIQHGKADKALEKLAERIKQAMDLRGCLYGN